MNSCLRTVGTEHLNSVTNHLQCFGLSMHKPELFIHYFQGRIKCNMELCESKHHKRRGIHPLGRSFSAVVSQMWNSLPLEVQLVLPALSQNIPVHPGPSWNCLDCGSPGCMGVLCLLLLFAHFVLHYFKRLLCFMVLIVLY